MKSYQKETELTESEFIEVLDEIYPEVEICGMKYSAGRALLELDPVAFRCAKSDHESNEDSENPVYVCGVCGEEFKDDETAADDCCKKEEN
jgi:hypothetical protein